MTRPAKSYIATRAVMVQASLNLSVGGNTNKEGKITCDKNKYEALATYQVN